MDQSDYGTSIPVGFDVSLSLAILRKSTTLPSPRMEHY